MYIYDRKLPGAQSLLKEQPISSQSVQRNSYYPDRGINGFGGRTGGSGSYVWATEDLGELSTELRVRPDLSVPFFPAKPAGSAGSPSPLPFPLFPPKPADPLTADPKMEQALKNAIAKS